MPTIIRLATEADAERVQAIYAPYVRDTVISFELEPPAVDEMAERIRKTLTWLVCEAGQGQVIGYAYASKHRDRAAYQWSVDVAVYIDQGFQRMGIGRGLYTALLGLLRWQGYFNAYAGITLPNASSIGLHTALGFQPVGVYPGVGYKFGQWHDVAWLGLGLQPRAESPAPPRPILALQNTAEAEAALKKAAALSRL